MSNRIIIFFILVRHGIPPLKPMGEILDVMNERLTDKEKNFFIKCAESRLVKEILAERLERRSTE